jgi:hypothetical protein
MLKPKIYLRYASQGLAAETFLLGDEASAAEGFSNPWAVPKPSCRAAGFQPALERWQTELPLAGLGGNNGYESPGSWEIFSPLRFSFNLL